MSTASVLRAKLDHAHCTLTQASWAPDWSTSESLLRETRDELATAVVPLLMDTDQDAETEELCTGGQVALQLVLQTLVTGGQYIAVGSSPVEPVRWLVAEALATLHDAMVGVDPLVLIRDGFGQV